jgi:hypothetical protein
MPVRLDHVLPLAERPGRPRIGLWLGALGLLVAAGLVAQALLVPRTQDAPLLLMGPAVLWPVAVWAALAGMRTMIFIGQQRSADGWDESREQDLDLRISVGRRSLSIMGMSLHSALRAPYSQVDTQLDALLRGEVAIRSQVSRHGLVERHSRLPGKVDEAHEALLTEAFANLLVDLAPTLSQAPLDAPVALLFSVDTNVADDTLQHLWNQAWHQSGIRQAQAPLTGKGLVAIDHWLDHRATDQGLLMVIALQIAPSHIENSAEVAVGLLLANQAVPGALQSLGCLHRPEPVSESENEQSDESLMQAARRALDWVPLQPERVGHVWRAGIGESWNASLSSTMSALLPAVDGGQGVTDLDALLGCAGVATPWLAITAAVLRLHREVEPQLVFSGEGSDKTALWALALTPVSTGM